MHKGDVALEVAPAGICLGVRWGSAPGALLPMPPAALGGGGSRRRGDAGVMLGAGRDPGSCIALAVPVSREIEMKENFLSPCPSCKSMRERERERRISPRDQQ